MKRYILQLMVLVLAFGTPGLHVPEADAAKTPTKTQQAASFCKNYPAKSTSTKVGRDQCKKAYLGGYARTGPLKKSFCNPSTLKDAKLTSCNKAFDDGTEHGNNDREREIREKSVSTCNGKGIKVSKALGTGGCIGGGDQNPIFALVAFGVQFLTGLFGLILVLVLVIAGFEYVISGEDPEISKDAKERIKAVLTGLLLFIIMFALIQIILPADVKIFNTSS